MSAKQAFIITVVCALIMHQIYIEGGVCVCPGCGSGGADADVCALLSDSQYGLGTQPQGHKHTLGFFQQKPGVSQKFP